MRREFQEGFEGKHLYPFNIHQFITPPDLTTIQKNWLDFSSEQLCKNPCAITLNGFHEPDYFINGYLCIWCCGRRHGIKTQLGAKFCFDKRYNQFFFQKRRLEIQEQICERKKNPVQTFLVGLQSLNCRINPFIAGFHSS